MSLPAFSLANLVRYWMKDDSRDWQKHFFNVTLPQIRRYCSLMHDETIDQLKERMRIKKIQVTSKQVTLDEILCEVFAIVKCAARIVLKIDFFDVQLLGATVLHAGKIAEMSTGEGKTYVAPLAICLNALTGKTVFLITSNEYLAHRDAELLKPLYTALGFEVGNVSEQMPTLAKKENYNKDIVYTCPSSIVFDYLRDKLITDEQDRLQPPYFFAIIDEVDQILMDSARTPLIISGSNKQSNPELYPVVAPIIQSLQPKHYTIIKASERAILTDEGMDYIEQRLRELGIADNIYDKENASVYNVISNLLHAHFILKNQRDYIVTYAGQVVLIDPFTHRTTEGRRFSHGLHQAIEALEGVQIHQETSIAAFTTYFSFATAWQKIAGMSGTCSQQRDEFKELYGLSIITVPTNRPRIRVDQYHIVLYKTERLMYETCAKQILEKNSIQPVLICTPSIEHSILCSNVFSQYGLKHKLLNARNAEEEANIIADAGMPKSITITTGMAGRGTDILLGGSLNAIIHRHQVELEQGLVTVEQLREKVQEDRQKVIEAGGLMVQMLGLFASEKTEQQTRGRAGRQGEPGFTMAAASREDKLVAQALPQPDQGLLESIAHNINFIDDQDALQDDNITRSMREIQDHHLTHEAYARKRQAELSDSPQNVKIPGLYGNFIFRDLLLRAKDVEALHFDLIQYSLKPFVNQEFNILKQDIQKNVIDILDGRNTGYDHVNVLPEYYELLECHSYTALLQKIKARIQYIYKHQGANLVLAAHDECDKELMIAEDAVRRTINTISYSNKNPATELNKTNYELLQKKMHNFGHELIRVIYSVVPEQNGMHSSHTFDQIGNALLKNTLLNSFKNDATDTQPAEPTTKVHDSEDYTAEKNIDIHNTERELQTLNETFANMFQQVNNTNQPAFEQEMKDILNILNELNKQFAEQNDILSAVSHADEAHQAYKPKHITDNIPENIFDEQYTTSIIDSNIQTPGHITTHLAHKPKYIEDDIPDDILDEEQEHIDETQDHTTSDNNAIPAQPNHTIIAHKLKAADNAADIPDDELFDVIPDTSDTTDSNNIEGEAEKTSTKTIVVPNKLSATDQDEELDDEDASSSASFTRKP
jgi:preprotein translocase subunit SecA